MLGFSAQQSVQTLAFAVEGGAAQARAGFKPFFGKPALVHLQHKANGFDGAVRVVFLRLHVGQIDDGAIVLDECGCQWNQSVAHPKALGCRLLEDEQHALALVEAGHAAQALLAGGFIEGEAAATLAQTLRAERRA